MKKIDDKVKVCFMTATYMDYKDAQKVLPLLEVE
jgi:hypothetical protein